jgi:hypothetical protein
MRRDAVYLCGGDTTPGQRDACPDPLHDWPLPDGYVDAAEVAASRLYRRWANVKCPICGLYGWRPGRIEPGERPTLLDEARRTE